MELVNRSNEHLKYKHPYPNTTLKSEYDITEQIYLTNTMYKITASFVHVYGHQDSKTNRDLTMEEKLNVEADKLAGLYQDDFGAYKPITHMYPSSPAILDINGTTITSNIRNQLQRAYTEPKYMGYLQAKYKWTDRAIGSIAWKCLNLGLKRINREVVLVKICNDQLPTATSLMKRKWQAHDCCSLCHQSETRDHMIQCQGSSRIEWRRKTMTTLRHRMETLDTKYIVSNTLCSCLTEWFEHGHINMSKYPEITHTAIRTQNEIGWRQLFNGKLAISWLTLQGRATTSTGKIREEYIWGASIVEVFLKMMIELWELRNEEVHGKEENEQQQKRKERAAILVRALHTKRDLARPSDSFLFFSDLDAEIESSSAIQLESFISMKTKAINNSVTMWKYQSTHEVLPILVWLRPYQNNNNTINNIQKRKRNKFIHEENNKPRRKNKNNNNKRHKRDSTKHTHLKQTSLSGYVSLTTTLY